MSKFHKLAIALFFSFMAALVYALLDSANGQNIGSVKLNDEEQRELYSQMMVKWLSGSGDAGCPTGLPWD